MMPLSFAREGEFVRVRKVSGVGEMKNHLEHLGFVPDAEVEVFQAQQGNVIVKLKGSKLALVKEMALKIMVDQC